MAWRAIGDLAVRVLAKLEERRGSGERAPVADVREVCAVGGKVAERREEESDPPRRGGLPAFENEVPVYIAPTTGKGGPATVAPCGASGQRSVFEVAERGGDPAQPVVGTHRHEPTALLRRVIVRTIPPMSRAMISARLAPAHSEVRLLIMALLIDGEAVG